MNKQPLVSIIIPSYNSEKYIREALESCLQQTYKHIEVIVVNDGSTDNSPSIIEDFAACYPEVIKNYTKQNGGSASARNLGVKKSQGEYFLFLDTDDVLMNDAIESLIMGIQEQKVDTVVGDWINFFEDSTPERYISSKFFYHNDPLASLIKQPMVESAIIIKRNPQTWNEKLVVNEIFDYFFSLFAEGYSIGYVNKVITKKRQHFSKERITVKYDHWHPSDWLEILKNYKNELKQREMLTFSREEAIDEHILTYLYAAKRRNIKINNEYFNILNNKNLQKFHWYKKFGVSGFVDSLGPKLGLTSFYLLNKIIGRA
ncbi:glycosyltransferase family 2 protein [Nostoc sp. CENA67]|uniref:Glycosyltransferase family 2 protein n=1 Tax=Amazonocrinis nigriterrae CENA67 TaxID=2794033 RepID=A0A8J7L949_9NOST|nr:glycosyltransferase family 2 protein [Amazonocrinis nigriterrae]MBH8561051.1 glycosyltransferase family 2 protein [Amazonocrinis nigriterrae CENA67]